MALSSSETTILFPAYLLLVPVAASSCSFDFRTIEIVFLELGSELGESDKLGNRKKGEDGGSFVDDPGESGVCKVVGGDLASGISSLASTYVGGLVSISEREIHHEPTRGS